MVYESDKIKAALELIESYGDTDGSHHKQWIIDQVVRCLVDDYDEWVRKVTYGVDGPNTYGWDEGRAP